MRPLKDETESQRVAPNARRGGDVLLQIHVRAKDFSLPPWRFCALPIPFSAK
jgi:hypothetical protein